ncbi:sigma-54-dependent Fis family transcriptional regulator [Xanthobacter sp. TB0139]|uniref:sigma-54-dependent Fis family transcriptional regulator n=1 Tax=Xanthobacter sp. TB0139 TaxID=3459178 RepID=UPI0040399237
MTARALQNARHRFFSGAGLSEDMVPASILRSWTRCAGQGLSSASHGEGPVTAHELRQLREQHEALRRRCRPELEALHAGARSAGSIVILSSPTGLLLDTVGSPDFADKAARVTLQPGADWSETARGTNAVGTALMERRAVEVHGAQHYAEPHGILSCAAAPILDPRGELVGLLDLSGPSSTHQLHALALVQLAAAQVEHRMFETAFAGHDVVRFHTDPHFLGTPHEGILVFQDHRLVAANRPGLALIGLDWTALDRQRFSDLFDGPLGRPTRNGEDRRVRSLSGDILHLQVEQRPEASPEKALTRKTSPLARGATAPNRTETGRTPVHQHALARRHDDAHPSGPSTGPATPRPCFDARTTQALGRAVRLLNAHVPVLVQGETGTGKEVFARQMHSLCTRAEAPFAAVNCAALPESLIESELFGYEEGAFTGARRAGFRGLLREADGGVLFLDEIGDMPLSLQTRLLRVLQEREVIPLGGGRAVPVDFQLICASHRDLRARVESGDFRADLYFRIAQYMVELPALRVLEDRHALVARFWKDMAGAEPQAPHLSPACHDLLASYEWPGNFRQFVGTLQVLLALAEPGEMLDVDALPPDVRQGFFPRPSPAERHEPPTALTTAPTPPQANGPGGVVRDNVARDNVARDNAATDNAPATHLGAITRAAIQAALEAHDGNISRAARHLGIHRSTLHRHLAGKNSVKKSPAGAA